MHLRFARRHRATALRVYGILAFYGVLFLGLALMAPVIAHP